MPFQPTQEILEKGAEVYCGVTKEQSIEYGKEEKFESACNRAGEIFEAMVGNRLDALIDYLESHESDIAWMIDDFGNLKEVFELLIGRCPKV